MYHGIVGLGEACKMANIGLSTHIEKLKELRNYYINRITKEIENIRINGSLEERLPGNANISFKNQDASTILIKLDEYGICASAGSACNTGKEGPSHVLTAIGLESEYANGALRVSFGEDNTIEDVDYLVDSIKYILKN